MKYKIAARQFIFCNRKTLCDYSVIACDYKKFAITCDYNYTNAEII